MPVYFDNAATTPLDKRVLKAMAPFFSDKFGNASSLHGFGVEAKEALEKSREKLADAIGAKPDEIVFTSGGTESDNLAVKCFALANKSKGNHIIVSAIEHDAVLNAAKWLEANGFDVTYLPVERDGIVSSRVFEDALTNKTILASIMHANNEIGTIQPIEKIGEICRENGVYLHTDAVQSFGKIGFDVEKLNVDLASFSAHKIYGPKGVGALYVRAGTTIEPLLHGGGQEHGLRSGTENVAGAVGFAKAAELAVRGMKKEAAREAKLRDKLVKGVLKIEGCFLNGHPVKRLPNNAHFYFRFVEGESIVLKLDEKGVAASTGSACSSKSLEPSHVLLAVGLRPEEAHGSLRLSLGRQNTLKEVNYVMKILPDIIQELRELSPIKSEKELAEALKLEHKHGAEAATAAPPRKHTYERLFEETEEKIGD